MSIADTLLAEYKKVSEAALWSENEKAAARATLRGVALSAGVYREFMEQVRDEPAAIVPAYPVEQQGFGGFIRF